MSNTMNIAIDGPASSGKSTVSEEISHRLKILHLNTGAMYRAFALYLLDAGIDINDEEAVERVCEQNLANITVGFEDMRQKSYLNGIDVSDRLRSEEVGLAASLVSSYKAVREVLVAAQQKIAQNQDIVLDGRDIGTVVLPDATVKVFLTASREVRAKRRYMELLTKGVNADYDEVLKDLIQRDKQDTQRKVSPLRQADDAVLIDSSNLSFEETVDTILKLVEQKNAEQND